MYAKPRTRSRKAKPGAKPGHAGARRPKPVRVGRREEHRLERCPECRGALRRCNRARTRLVEDMPENVRLETVEHTIHRDYCFVNLKD